MTENLDQLREVAEQATPGPWEAKPYLYGVQDDGRIRVTSPSDGNEYNLVEGALPENATHIATFDPPTVLALIERVQAAEAKLATLEARIASENLRWVAWEMVENSGQLDLPDVAWINKISEGEVSLEAAKHHFFGGSSPCSHLSGLVEPFDIEDEARPACEHCNRTGLDGGDQE